MPSQNQSETPTDWQSILNAIDRLANALENHNQLLLRQVRPYVIVDIVSRYFVNTLYLRIRNVGGTPAYSVSIKFDPPLSIRDKPAKGLRLFQSIPVLGPGDEITVFFDTAIGMFDDSTRVLRHEVMISYDGELETYTETMSLDFELMRGLSPLIPAPDKITSELEGIKKDVERITRYFQMKEFAESAKYLEKQEGQETATDETSPEV